MVPVLRMEQSVPWFIIITIFFLLVNPHCIQTPVGLLFVAKVICTTGEPDWRTCGSPCEPRNSNSRLYSRCEDIKSVKEALLAWYRVAWPGLIQGSVMIFPLRVPENELFDERVGERMLTASGPVNLIWPGPVRTELVEAMSLLPNPRRNEALDTPA